MQLSLSRGREFVPHVGCRAYVGGGGKTGIIDLEAKVESNTSNYSSCFVNQSSLKVNGEPKIMESALQI